MPVVCGVVGYVGNQERCVEALTVGLRRLEYRGYDSAGLALQSSRPHRSGVPVLELATCWDEQGYGAAP